MISAPAGLSLEVLQFQQESSRARNALALLADGARAQGMSVQRTLVYHGTTAWLLVWGPGAPLRAEIIRHHVAGGGHVIALDLAYWNRDKKVRVSIDAAHPSAWVMRREWPRDRFDRDPAPMGDRWAPTGPIIIAGLGHKARVQYGAGTIDTWERETMLACRARWPDRRLLYRRKRREYPPPSWATLAPDAPIDIVLAGASLVLTWHSNVAVDAIRLGIPAICREGAAAAVCPADLGDVDPQPLAPDLRDRFLTNLAWFQWQPEEAGACWQFLQELLA